MKVTKCKSENATGYVVKAKEFEDKLSKLLSLSKEERISRISFDSHSKHLFADIHKKLIVEDVNEGIFRTTHISENKHVYGILTLERLNEILNIDDSIGGLDKITKEKGLKFSIIFPFVRSVPFDKTSDDEYYFFKLETCQDDYNSIFLTPVVELV